ncbi:MAG: hypothetical protein FJW14_14835 [Acidimicrobiia bacterium]|nr:hypothetical protein [Acidimicrobiia bacterium]
MKTGHRTPAEEVIAAKVPAAIAEHIKRAAREDDRTVSAWLRRHFADVFGVSPKLAPRDERVEAGPDA